MSVSSVSCLCGSLVFLTLVTFVRLAMSRLAVVLSCLVVVLFVDGLSYVCIVLWLSCLVSSRLVLSFPVLSCLVWFDLVLSCLALSCLALSCLDGSCIG